jgi:hypothetical protein
MRFRFSKSRLQVEVHKVERRSKSTSDKTMTTSLERRLHMQHDSMQQEQQNNILHEDRQPFIEEIAALRSLAGVAGVTDHLLAELDDFQLQVEHLDASAWELKEVRNLSRNELVQLSLAVLRAYNSQSN